MVEDHIQQEFNSLIQGKNPETSPNAQPNGQSVEDMLEFDLGEQKFKVPYSYELPIKHNGTIVKTPLEKLINTFRQNQHFEDKNIKFRQEREAFEKQRKELGDIDSLRQKYGAIQDWSEKNPEQWERLWQAYQDRDRLLNPGNNADNPLLSELEALKRELGPLKEFHKEYMTRAEQEQNEKVTAEVEKEIEDFNSKYGKKYGINLGEKDDEGLTLTARIVKHGIDKGYPDFTSSALTYLAPRLLTTVEHSGRVEAANSIKNDRKNGILSRSDTPIGGEKFKLDPTKMSESERDRAAHAELAQLISNKG